MLDLPYPPKVTPCLKKDVHFLLGNFPHPHLSLKVVCALQVVLEGLVAVATVITSIGVNTAAARGLLSLLPQELVAIRET